MDDRDFSKEQKSDFMNSLPSFGIDTSAIDTASLDEQRLRMEAVKLAIQINRNDFVLGLTSTTLTSTFDIADEIMNYVKN